MAMRIAVGGIRHETNTFSPLRTGGQDFTVRRDALPFQRLHRPIVPLGEVGDWQP
jgi:microcystin degradation protein MlrC